MPENPVTQMVRCPRCRKSVVYDLSNAFRPFCSNVCKNEDIIGWAQEDFRIPGGPVKGPGDDPKSDEPED